MPGSKHLEEFAATRPQYRIDAITARANLLANNGDAPARWRCSTARSKEYPDSVELRFARVFQLEGADKVDESIAELRKLVDGSARRSGGDQRARLHAGRSHAPASRRTEADRAGAGADAGQRRRARQHGLGAASRRPQRGRAQYLEHAKRRINDPEVDLHLGEVLLALDRKNEARDVWSKASERYPDNDELKQRLQKLN